MMEALSSIFSVEAATATRRYSVIISLLAVLVARRLWRARGRRTRTLPPCEERVLILGASGGIGRAIAHEYAARGARVCAVGRRERELAAVADECAALLPSATGLTAKEGGRGEHGDVFASRGDFASAEDMGALRDELQRSE